MPTIFIL